MPYLQRNPSVGTIAVRSELDPATLVKAIRVAVARLDASLPVHDVAQLEARVSASLAPRRFTMMLLGSFAALALLLAVVGIYGVVSYFLAQRKHEIGLRLARGHVAWCSSSSRKVWLPCSWGCWSG